MNITQEGEEITKVKWINFLGEEIEVEKGSKQDKEFRNKLHSIGLWEDDDPNKPEDCISFEEYLKQRDEHKDRTIRTTGKQNTNKTRPS